MSNRKNDTELEMVFAGLPWLILLRVIIWFQHTLIYNMQRQLISHGYSHASFWWTNLYVCNWLLQDTKLKNYLQDPISSTSEATFLVVSHVFTNVLVTKFQDLARTRKKRTNSVVFAA